MQPGGPHFRGARCRVGVEHVLVGSDRRLDHRRHEVQSVGVAAGAGRPDPGRASGGRVVRIDRLNRIAGLAVLVEQSPPIVALLPLFVEGHEIEHGLRTRAGPAFGGPGGDQIEVHLLVHRVGTEGQARVDHVPAGLADGDRDIRQPLAVESRPRLSVLRLAFREDGIHHEGRAAGFRHVLLPPVDQVRAEESVELRIGVDGGEVDLVRDHGGHVGPREPVVVGGNGLRDLTAHGADVASERFRIGPNAGEVHLRLVADADGQDDVLERRVVGQRHGLRDRPVVRCIGDRLVCRRGIRVAEDEGAELHLHVQVVVRDDLQGLLGHLVVAGEQANHAEARGQHQVEVLLNVGRRDHLRVQLRGVPRGAVSAVGHRLAARELRVERPGRHAGERGGASATSTGDHDHGQDQRASGIRDLVRAILCGIEQGVLQHGVTLEFVHVRRSRSRRCRSSTLISSAASRFVRTPSCSAPTSETVPSAHNAPCQQTRKARGRCGSRSSGRRC